MRETCIECVVKHVGSAVSLLTEAFQGYREHLVFACGELNEAEKESIMKLPALAAKIRETRKAILEDGHAAMCTQDAEVREKLLRQVADIVHGLVEDVMGELDLARMEGRDIKPSDKV